MSMALVSITYLFLYFKKASAFEKRIVMFIVILFLMASLATCHFVCLLFMSDYRHFCMAINYKDLAELSYMYYKVCCIKPPKNYFH